MWYRRLLLCALLPSIAFGAALSDFEGPETLTPWHADKGVELKLVAEHASSGKRALRVAFPAGSHGVWMEPAKPLNWLSRDKLTLDVYNAHGKDTLLVVRVFDAKGKQLEKKEKLQLDILIEKGKIKSIGNFSEESFEGETLNIAGKYVIPGFLDMHVHFREPGREDETAKIRIRLE